MSVEIANNTMAGTANDAGRAGTANDAGRAGTVFRFKFHPDINAMLQRFAAVHHGDDLEEFKDSWETLLARYRTAIDIEIQRLQEIGFTGDVENKMFVSVRYYYCKQFKIGGENNTDDREEQAIVQNGTADAGAAAGCGAGCGAGARAVPVGRVRAPVRGAALAAPRLRRRESGRRRGSRARPHRRGARAPVLLGAVGHRVAQPPPRGVRRPVVCVCRPVHRKPQRRASP